MIHSAVVRLTDEGVLLRSTDLEPLGIFSESVCWGLWLPNRSGDWIDDDSVPADDHSPFRHSAKVEKGRRLRDHQHLLIAPFHPTAWPLLFRIELKLVEAPGSLARAAKTLSRAGLSILHSDSNPSGFAHATWSVVAQVSNDEADKLYRYKERVLDQVFPGVRADGLAERVARRVADRFAVYMLLKRRSLLAEIRRSHEERPFLYEPSLRGDQRMFDSAGVLATYEHFFKLLRTSRGRSFKARRFLSELSPEVRAMLEGLTAESASAATGTAHPPGSAAHTVDEYLRSHVTPAIGVKWIRSLAYASVYGGGYDTPIEFVFSSKSSFLRATRKGFLSESSFEGLHSGRVPKLAVATVRMREKALRIDPITSRRLRHELMQICVGFHVKSTKDSVAVASRGLVAKLARRIRSVDKSIDLIRVSNKFSQHQLATKSGMVEFLVDASQEHIQPLEKRLGSATKQNVEVTGVSVTPFPSRTLFVSMRFGHPQDDNIRRIVNEVGLAHGFDAVTVETHVSPVTRLVVDRIEECDAFLQLLVFRKSDDPDTTRFSWLDFEYGVAAGCKKPTIRLVDTTRRDYDWWAHNLTIDKDQRMLEFRTDVSDTSLRTALGGAIGELAAHAEAR